MEPVNPKILLLTAAYGTGHLMSMQGIMDALTARGLAYQELDTVAIGGVLDKFTAKVFMLSVSRWPFLWRLLYPYPITSGPLVRKLYRLLYKGKFNKQIAVVKPDIIIANHHLAAFIGTLYKEKHPNVKVYTIVTDYVAHPLWYWPGVDHYFVGMEETKRDLEYWGVKQSTISADGIPIRKAFWHLLSRDEAKREVGFPQDKPVVLFSTGSYNSTPLTKLLQSLKGRQDVYVAVLGSKKQSSNEYYESLLKQFQLAGKVFGFVDYVAKIMAASDLFVTKAGGISVAESLAAGLPCIFVRNFPGQEAGNAKIMAAHGAAINAQSIPHAIEALKTLLADRTARNAISDHACALGRPEAAIEVVHTILREWNFK